jgi:hypothetical protein
VKKSAFADFLLALDVTCAILLFDHCEKFLWLELFKIKLLKEGKMLKDIEAVDETLSSYSNEVLGGMLEKFFAKKSMYYGGPVSRNDLQRIENYQLMRCLSLAKAIDIFYQALQDHNSTENPQAFFLRLQEECFSFSIPKHFVGGILILYLKYCRGYDL